VRTVTATLPPSAQVLGSADLADCTPTIDSLSTTSPSDPGDCTSVALASDNPGYTPDLSPPPPLKKVIAAFGPSCSG